MPAAHHESALRCARDRVFAAYLLHHQLRHACDHQVRHVCARGTHNLFVAVEAQRHDGELAAVTARVREVLAALGHEIMRRKRAGERIVRRGPVEGLPVGLELPAVPYQPQHVVQAHQHLGSVGRLGDEIVRPQVARALLASLLFVARNDDDRKIADARVLGFADAREQAETVELGHVEVGEHHDDLRVAFDRLPRRLAVAFLAHRERGAEDRGKSGADEL